MDNKEEVVKSDFSRFLSVIDEITFNGIINRNNNIKNNTNSREKPYKIILIGNKKDLYDSRVISYEMGQEIAEIYGMEFIEICYNNYRFTYARYKP